MSLLKHIKQLKEENTALKQQLNDLQQSQTQTSSEELIAQQLQQVNLTNRE